MYFLTKNPHVHGMWPFSSQLLCRGSRFLITAAWLFRVGSIPGHILNRTTLWESTWLENHQLNYLSHRIHVWNMNMVPTFDPINITPNVRYIYHTWILWVIIYKWCFFHGIIERVGGFSSHVSVGDLSSTKTWEMRLSHRASNFRG